MVRRLDDRCNFRRTQSLYLASSRKDVKLLERECAVRQKCKFRVRLLASEELAPDYLLVVDERAPQLRLIACCETGTSWHGAQPDVGFRPAGADRRYE